MSKKPVIKKPVIETHGKVEAPIGQKTQPSSLEQIFGMDGTSRYGTLDENVYITSLASMNRPELERETRKRGLVVVESTDRLRDNLVKEFRVFVSSLNKPYTNVGKAKPTDAAQKILAEGR